MSGPPAAAPGPKALRILLLEDVPSDAELVLAELRRAGLEFEWRRVEDERGLRDALATFAPDLVLSDYRLPSFDGMSALKLVMAQAPEMPFIVVTGSINEETAVDCMKAGATDYVLKERLSRLPTAVQAALRGKATRVEARRSADALRESEERLKRAVEATAIGLYDWDITNDEIHFVARGREYMALPKSSVEAVQRAHPDDAPRFVSVIERVIAGDTDEFDETVRFLALDGSWRWLRDRGVVTTRDAQGRASRLFGSYEDVTERTMLEMQLRQSQKMEAIGNLAGGVAHDFNNLLTAITGHAELARDAVGEDSPAQEHIDEILRAVTRAAGLTGQLLAFSRKQVLQPRVVDLNDVVHDTGRMLARVIRENVRLTTRLDGAIGRVVADPNQLVQVLLNLVVNARDAMPAGGEITIRTFALDVDAAAAAEDGGIGPGPHVVLEVADTGTGMDAAVLAHIFEPFFTTKDQGSGTGLGLSTVYGIVQQSGGTIRVSSEPGKGTCFKVLFPRVDAPPEPEAPIASGPRTGRGESILLVEDDDLVRRLVLLTLSSRGYQIISAGSPDEALRAAADPSTRIDLLVTDVVLPQMSGRELARRLAADRPGLRVLYTSGHTTGSIVTDGVLEAGLAFLQKPFRPDELCGRVRELLDAPAGTFGF